MCILSRATVHHTYTLVFREQLKSSNFTAHSVVTVVSHANTWFGNLFLYLPALTQVKGALLDLEEWPLVWGL